MQKSKEDMQTDTNVMQNQTNEESGDKKPCTYTSTYTYTSTNTITNTSTDTETSTSKETAPAREDEVFWKALINSRTFENQASWTVIFNST